jgi:hypothetical protein
VGVCVCVCVIIIIACMCMLANCGATRCVGFLANNQPLRGNGERIRPARASARYNYVILWRASYAPAPLLYDIIVARARILLLLC